ncbi:UNVERIFIED_CONTAM: hypothetical protein Sradi_6921200 [Sesamum radiatum]|uniref:Uncharacterized protein n=1 Tax=Sesamum radiatum TaxID=300843 RepID=A0AAW2JJ83_SESRA
MADAAVEFLLHNLQQLLLYHAHLISDARNQVESWRISASSKPSSGTPPRSAEGRQPAGARPPDTRRRLRGGGHHRRPRHAGRREQVQELLLRSFRRAS